MEAVRKQNGWMLKFSQKLVTAARSERQGDDPRRKLDPQWSVSVSTTCHSSFRKHPVFWPGADECLQGLG